MHGALQMCGVFSTRSEMMAITSLTWTSQPKKQSLSVGKLLETLSLGQSRSRDAPT